MITSIFIKTYAGDADWLKYCLRSIKRFCSGFHEVVVVSEDDMSSVVNPFGFTFKRCAKPVDCEGYMWQQVVKLYATDYVSDPDWICFVDSDCVFLDQNTPDTWFFNGKPILLVTPYSDLEGKVPWKPITEKAIGVRCEYETMRRHPSIYSPKHLASTRNRIYDVHHVQCGKYVTSQPGREFSEFNALGAWNLLAYPEDFHVIDTTKHDLPHCPLKQYWSWGGIDADKHREIENILS